MLATIFGGFALYLWYVNYYLEPLQKTAFDEMSYAKSYMDRDSLEIALNGDGQFYGFKDIIEEYSGTKAANLAKYYVGIINYRLGKFEESIDAFKSYSAGDDISKALSKGSIGDAHSQLKDYEKAVYFYMEAARYKNELTAPMYLFKAANISVDLEKYDLAEKLYHRIKDDYPNSIQADNVEKYLTKVQAKHQ